MKTILNNRLQSSELFCKVQTSCNVKSLIERENVSNELCSLQALQSSLQTSKTIEQQQLNPNRGLYCRPPISFRDREVIPADAVLPLKYCVKGLRAWEVL